MVRSARDPGRESEDFAEAQQALTRAFRAAHPAGAAARVSHGLVVIPTDSATAAQREKYAAYVAARTPRTASPQGPARMMFACDLLGSAEQIAEELYAHAGFPEAREVAAKPSRGWARSACAPARRGRWRRASCCLR